MGIDNPVHILFIAAVALVVLGPKRLPELARAAGKSMREFREALNGGVVDEPIGGQVVQQPPTGSQVVQQSLPVGGQVVQSPPAAPQGPASAPQAVAGAQETQPPAAPQDLG